MIKLLYSSRTLALLKSVVGCSQYAFVRTFISHKKMQSLLKTVPTFQIEENGVHVKRCSVGVHVNSIKLFHCFTALNGKQEDDDKIVVVFREFEDRDTKNKTTFLETIRLYESSFPNRRGHVDFIRTALHHMKEYGVHKDLESYKAVLDVLPKGVLVCTNRWQVELMSYPRQQMVAIELLDQLEYYGVTPDVELGDMLTVIFGKLTFPCRKFKKMLYWNMKFRNISPWPVQNPAPDDAFLLGKLAIERITSVDIESEISIYKSEDVSESVDSTWIVSGQSPKQKDLLQNHPVDAPVIVEGGDIVWLRDKYVKYYVLKGDFEGPPYEPPKDSDDISNMESMYFNPNYVHEESDVPKSVHVQDDGIIYAVCATGTSSKDSLLSWVRLLQKNGNPILEKVPVLFRLKTSEKVPAPFSDELVAQ